jgi:hypothetical protein
LKFLSFAIASLILAVCHTSQAQNNSNCAAIIKSAHEAASNADWVIEGDVINTVKMNTHPNRIEVSIENATVLYESEKSPRFFTAMLQADSCFPNAQTTLWGKAADKFVGKRIRFFGTKLTSGRGRRFFFIQPAEQPMPSMPVNRKEFLDKKHASEAVATTQDGWLKARSTDGHFSIEMPGPFEDITKGSGEQPAFMLRGADQHGSTFIAVFERAGPNSGMGGTFDSTILKPNAAISKFKGTEAVSTLGELPGSNGEKLTHGLWFRVPGGTFMLGVVTNKGQAESLKSKERFFNSLTFE